jgi:hypothetical protein
MWLFHEDFFSKHPMQEGIVHTKLFEWPIEIESKCQNQSYHCCFDHKVESLYVVESIALLEALNVTPRELINW